ncbi:MAG: hypothetical protein IJ745_07280 [Bacteroidales bacterium]|nr:hypothetical protein [Bacteroidales bacterium]
MFSIKASSIRQAPVEHITVEVKELTEADLKTYWQEAGEALGLSEILADGLPKMGERPGLFEVDAQSVAFLQNFRPHKVDVMEFMRKKTGMKMLDCKVNPLFVEKTEVIYSPDDKYAAMLAANPSLAELRKLFPMVDY